MINPRNRIYQAFKTALDGIVYNSNSIPVYSFPAPGNIPFYIQLGTISTVEEGCKDLFGHECTIDIQVIDQRQGNYGSPKQAEEISNFVIQRLKETTTSVKSIPDFNMVYIVLDNSFEDPMIFDTSRGYRGIQQFRFYIEEVKVLGDWILDTGFWNDAGIWKDTSNWID